MPYIIIAAVWIILLFVIMGAVYSKSSKILGRIQDYCIVKNTKASSSPVLVFLVGLWWFCLQITYWSRAAELGSQSRPVGALLLGIVIMVLPFAWLFFRCGPSFFKVFIIKAIALPVHLVQGLSGIFSTHKKSKTVEGWNKRTTYTWQLPERIVQDNWDLHFVYYIGGNEYYENFDGTRCIVDHKHTLSFENVQYNIRPLYNINEPLPRWIAWLY